MNYSQFIALKKRKLNSTIVAKTIAVFAVVVIAFFGNTQQGLFTKKLKIEDGLISYDNYNILNDKKGNVWVCSKAGVTRFSPRSFKRFTTNEGLLNNDVWKLDEDLQGRIWISDFSSGIQYIQNDVVQSVKSFEKFEQVFYSGSVKDTTFFTVSFKNSSQRFYLTSKGRTGRYKRFHTLGYEIKLDLRNDDIFILTPLNKKNTENYLYNLETKKIEKLNYPVFPIHYGPVKDNLHFLHSVIDDKVQYYYPENGKLIKIKSKSLPQQNIMNLCESQNFITVAENNDFKIYDNSKSLKRRVDIEQLIKNQLPGKLFKGIIVQDHRKNFWVSELRGNVYFIHNEAYGKTEYAIDEFSGAAKELLNPIKLKGSDLTIYQTFDNKVNALNLKTGKQTNLIVGESAIRKIAVKNNKLYILFVNKLVEYSMNQLNGDLWINDLAKKEFNFHEFAFSFDFLSDTSIVLSNKYVLDIKHHPMKHISTFEKLQLPQRPYHLQNSGSFLFYMSDNEIGVFDKKKMTQKVLPIKNPTFVNEIDNFLIVESAQNGIFSFNLNTQSLVKLTNQNFVINEIMRYGNQFLVCTNNGLFLANINLNKWEIIKSFLSDPSLGVMVNGIVILDNSKGVVAFTNQGAIRINSVELEERNAVNLNYYFLLKDLYSNKIGNNHLLDNQSNSVSVEFHDGSFFNYTFNVFRYKLVGVENGWKYTKNNNVTYKDLEPGDYTFIIESSDSEFGSFSNRKTITFTIDLPFYTKFWFYGLCALFLVLIFTTIFYYRKSYILRKNELQSKMRELEFQALKAQLNPHFVFNALNSIQSLAYNNDKLKLNEYICSFSDLIRNVLDASKQVKISLKDEIQFLSNYLNIEKMRLGESFSYQIIDNTVQNSQYFEIYGMILQPIVENCIVHGFRTDQPIKSVKITFEIIDNMIVSTITDNGIGRVASEKLKHGKAHKSWASTILQEKSKLLNSINKNEILIHTVDLYNEKNESNGTQVIVKMKISNII